MLLIVKYSDENAPRIAYVDITGVVAKISSRGTEYGRLLVKGEKNASKAWDTQKMVSIGQPRMTHEMKRRRSFEVVDHGTNGSEQFVAPSREAYAKRDRQNYLKVERSEVPLSLYH